MALSVLQTNYRLNPFSTLKAPMTDTTNDTTAITPVAHPRELNLAPPMASPGNTALMLDPRHMDSMMRVSDAMAAGTVTVPQHLRGKPGDCLAVIMQAVQWGMNPFAVAQKTHLVNGTLGYEAQLVNAVLQSSGAIKGQFRYEYRGEGTKLECRVGAIPAGETELLWNEWLSASDVTTKNSPLWKTNPKQQLGYLQVKNWARAYKPGALLGVYTDDELLASPPVNMGHVERVEVPPKLLADAQAAADNGRKAFDAFWKSLLPPERTLLAQHTDDLKARVEGHDKARTVDTGSSPAPAATTAPAKAPAPEEGGPVATYAQVADAIRKAKNFDALEEAGLLIGQVADAQHRSELSKLYDDTRAALL